MEEQTEREKYEQALEEKLRKAGKAKRFLSDEDGSIVTEWLTTQINATLKEVAGKGLLDKPTEYAYKVGNLHAYQKLLTMLNAEASTNTAEIKDKLNESKSDQQ
jgi:hypothetical protein